MRMKGSGWMEEKGRGKGRRWRGGEGVVGKKKEGGGGRRGRDGGRGGLREVGRGWGKVVVDEEPGLLGVMASEGPSGGPVM